jgi:predicted ATPase/DNA-binding SARP family transcriptional activator/Tfp pilus assembly protein PilF
MTHLAISLLGTLQVTLDGEPVANFATDKARALLAYLAVEADHPHRRDTLAGLLWPDQPQGKARQNLRQALSDLRRAILDDDDVPFLFTSRESIQFNPDCGAWLDVAEVLDLVGACETHRHRHPGACLPCLRRLERLVDLYRGPFLAQFFLEDADSFEEWAMLKREGLHYRMIEALSSLVDYYERCGDHRRAQQHARRLVQMEPWREEAHRKLMCLLALDGQRSAALTQYEVCRRALDVDLGVEPTSETQKLYESIRAGDFSDRKPPRGAPSYILPTSFAAFVGREGELADLFDMLANPDCRLVTLVGPGGVGKTRLALRAAVDHQGVFADGVVFVPLAPISTIDHLAPAIAAELGIPFLENRDPEVQLLDFLRRKDLLLVLDNMEHLLGGVNLLSAILHRAPGVVLLVTSRERLNVHEEWAYEVEGLAYPKDEDAEVEGSYSALELFQERANQVDRHFTLSEAAVPHVVHICRLVEGMPLGIEMAASWVSIHSCEEIAQEIVASIDTLATRLRNVPERHRSLWATFDHSFQLLEEEERRIFANLSVFRSGFTLEAAVQVAGASSAILAALQDKSFVRRTTPNRYDMHEMLQQYAAGKLQDAPQAYEEARSRHARYFTVFLAQRVEQLQGEGQKQAMAEITPEIENARQAWQTAIALGQAGWAAQSLDGLYHFYDMRGWAKEGLALFALAIDRWRGDLDQEALFGKALARQGACYKRLGQGDLAREGLEQSLEIFERLRVPVEQAFCLVTLAQIARDQGMSEKALGLAQKGLDLARDCQNPHIEACLLHILGSVRFRLGQIERAKALFKEGLAVSQAHGNRRLSMTILNALGDLACHPGDYAEARASFEACLAMSREIDDPFNAAQYLNNLGTVFHICEQYEEAQQCYQESLDICRRIGDVSGQSIALSNLGEIAQNLDALDQALAYHREALSIGRDLQEDLAVLVCLNNLGEVACALEDWDSAKAYLSEALAVAHQAQIILLISRVLVNLALFFGKQGQDEQAASLLGLVIRHPSSEQYIKKRAQELLDELDLALPVGEPPVLEEIVPELIGDLASSF